MCHQAQYDPTSANGIILWNIALPAAVRRAEKLFSKKSAQSMGNPDEWRELAEEVSDALRDTTNSIDWETLRNYLWLGTTRRVKGQASKKEPSRECARIARPWGMCPSMRKSARGTLTATRAGE